MQMLEHKFMPSSTMLAVEDHGVISGYASLFDRADQGGDLVRPGAFAGSLKRLATAGRAVKMLWQHDPAQPIGIWDDIHEDARGLWVKGRLLPDVARAREAQALIAAGAIDGLSIGYRTERASKASDGTRHLHQLDLWEVSLVTFPMLPTARLDLTAKGDDADGLTTLCAALRQAGAQMRPG